MTVRVHNLIIHSINTRFVHTTDGVPLLKRQYNDIITKCFCLIECVTSSHKLLFIAFEIGYELSKVFIISWNLADK